MRWAPIRCQEGGRTLTIITTESITRTRLYTSRDKRCMVSAITSPGFSRLEVYEFLILASLFF